MKTGNERLTDSQLANKEKWLKTSIQALQNSLKKVQLEHEIRQVLKQLKSNGRI